MGSPRALNRFGTTAPVTVRTRYGEFHFLPKTMTPEAWRRCKRFLPVNKSSILPLSVNLVDPRRSTFGELQALLSQKKRDYVSSYGQRGVILGFNPATFHREEWEWEISQRLSEVIDIVNSQGVCLDPAKLPPELQEDLTRLNTIRRLAGVGADLRGIWRLAYGSRPFPAALLDMRF